MSPIAIHDTHPVATKEHFLKLCHMKTDLPHRLELRHCVAEAAAGGKVVGVVGVEAAVLSCVGARAVVLVRGAGFVAQQVPLVPKRTVTRTMQCMS